MAADLAAPRYSEAPGYEYRTASPVVFQEPAPVMVAPPPVVIEDYPVYAAPPVYVAPPTYAYAGLVWREGWGHRGSLPRPSVESLLLGSSGSQTLPGDLESPLFVPMTVSRRELHNHRRFLLHQSECLS